MMVYCVFSLESPQRGDSKEFIQYTISQYKKENNPKLSQICNYGIWSKGLKNEFELAVVNRPSVFEPLKFYCIWFGITLECSFCFIVIYSRTSMARIPLGP